MENQSAPVAGKLEAVTGLIKRKRIMFGVIAVAGVLLMGYLAWGSPNKASGEYLLDTVKRATITSTISASGKVEPVSTVSLSFKNSEVINKIHVKAGDRVARGHLLAEQDSSNLESQVRQAMASVKGAAARLELLKNGPRQEDLGQSGANLSMARAAYEQAKSNLERSEILYQQGVLARSDLENVQVEYANAGGRLKQAEESHKALVAGSRPEDIASAAAQLESSQAQLDMARHDLAGTKMTNPIGGIVSQVNGAEGQRATATNNNTSGGGFIVVISEEMQVRAQVNEGDIGRAGLGQMVEFTVNSFPNKVFTGRVGSVSPQAYTEANVQLYDVVVQLEKNYPELKAGMPANVNIIIERRENALAIPKGAVSYAIGHLNRTGQGIPGAGEAGSGDNRRSRASSGEGPPAGQAAGPTVRSSDGQNDIPPAGQNAGQSARPGASGERSAGQKQEDAESSVTQEQRAVVMVLTKSGSPEPRQVVLGIADLRNFEVVRGLNEGETVITGSLSRAATGSGQGSTGGMPFMMRGAGGRP